MYVLQAVIVFAVISADIYFGWGAQGYAATALGVIAAYLLTVPPLKFIDWVSNRRARNGMRL